MSKKQKTTSTLSYFAKQRRKESTEIKVYEQETDSLTSTCSTSASQSIEFDSAEEPINLGRPNIASDDIAKILPFNRSNYVNKLYSLKNALRPVEEAAMVFDFRKCCTAKNNNFVISAKIISEHNYGWYIQKVANAFIANTVLCVSTSLVICGVGKNRQKPGSYSLNFFAPSISKLTGSDGYLHELDNDRLE